MASIVSAQAAQDWSHFFKGPQCLKAFNCSARLIILSMVMYFTKFKFDLINFIVFF